MKKKATLKKAVKKEAAPVAKVTTATKKSVTKSVVKKDVLKVNPDAIYATGRRKSAIAKVWLFKGTGVVSINHQEAKDYLSSERLAEQVLVPLKLVSLDSKYNVRIDVIGGGLTGQADASRLGLSRAVIALNGEYRSVLKEHGLLTQDSREKERKKYGKRGARKSPQYRKR